MVVIYNVVMRKMRIVADSAIPFVKELFPAFGELRILPSNRLTKENIKSNDVLLIRSVTRAGQDLLERTNIKIIGSMTSGIDHIDRHYLKKNRIKLIYAPGSNANSVAEYVISCLLIIARKKNFDLTKKTIGIIGVGNIGTFVAKKCEALGMRVLLQDPPKYNRTGNRKYLSLKNLSDADIITIHTPLSYKGKYPTFHMVNREFLMKIKPGTILINTSRGAVFDEKILLKFLPKINGLIIDVWENEPDINIELLKAADIATPHIAGYSLDGKLNAAVMVFNKLSKLFNRTSRFTAKKFLSGIKEQFSVTPSEKDTFQIIFETIIRVYNPLEDHNKMLKIIRLEKIRRPVYFEMLRRNYPVRREFFNYQIVLDDNKSKTASVLKRLGFKIKSSSKRNTIKGS